MLASCQIVLPIKAGRTGNNLFQLAFAHYLSKQFGNAEIVHFGLPELDIPEHPAYRWAIGLQADFIVNQDTDLRIPLFNSELKMTSGIIQTSAWGMNSKYFEESRDYLLKLLPQRLLTHDATTSELETETLCHVRGGDVWDRSRFRNGKNLHPDYSALPVSYYEKILETSNKRIKFLIEKSTPDWYTALLVDRFGQTAISSSSTVQIDFRRMLLANNLGLSLSTFSWMAGFLGNANVVHFPVIGLFNPLQRPDLDFSVKEKKVQKYFFSPHNWTGSKKDIPWLLNSNVKVGT